MCPSEKETTTSSDLAEVELEDDIEKSHHPAGSFLKRGSVADQQNLSWSNVNMCLKDKKGEVTKHILKDVWGCANAGQTTAIMGARREIRSRRRHCEQNERIDDQDIRRPR